MIASSAKAAKPVFHIQLHPVIHIHAPEPKTPTVNVESAAAQVSVSPNITLKPSEVVVNREARPWKFEVRDETGRITKTIIATPQ